MRVTFVISSLSSGGAERVMSHMANYWSRKGWEVALITLADSNQDFFQLDGRINRRALNITGISGNLVNAMLNNLTRLKNLRRHIVELHPDVVISFIEKTNVLTLLATIFTDIPVIVAEHTDPRRHKIAIIWRFLRYLAYPKSAALIVLTHNVLNWARKFVGVNKAHVIANSITLDVDKLTDVTEYNSPFILSVGKLEIVKGFDLLIQAFHQIASSHPQWQLVILGEGSQRASLEAWIKDHGLERRILMPGLHPGPMAVMKYAELFVMSSRYEGFPIVLLEALACGLPVISFDCESGPRDILRHNIDGILVPPGNIDELATAMRTMMSNIDMREKMGIKAKDVIERFNEDRIMATWETMISHILLPTGKRKHLHV